jgi:hypothetical protein
MQRMMTQSSKVILKGESVLQIKTKIVSSHTADSRPVKQEVNSTLILPPLVFLALPIIAKVVG